MLTRQEKIEKLAAIADEIASCDACPELCQSIKNPVPGEGDPESDIMFVGEAPGAREDETGRPFVGAAGKFLEEMLVSIGLTREKVFITNIVKYRPPGNRDPLPAEIKACLPFLLAQIKVIQPKLIVFLGRHSMNVFFPELKISAAHGRPVRRGGQVFLPLYHPAAALYNGGMRTSLLDDFAKIPKILEQIN